jgi:hypothetical protein
MNDFHTKLTYIVSETLVHNNEVEIVETEEEQLLFNKTMDRLFGIDGNVTPSPHKEKY